MEEGLGISEQLPEDEGGDNEAVGVEVFDITCNGIESDSDQVRNIETTAGQILEFESHETERNCEHVLNFESGDPRDNSHQLLELHSDGLEDPRCGNTTILDGHTGSSLGKSCPPLAVGMEFESYEDAYNYYNCYAKELGFAIRVKSSWTKRNSKEKRGAVLCCNCEGFKTMKEANSRRKETRTGCLAMIRLRLVESNRWRVDEVKLEHNHLFDPERMQNSKSHKKMDAGVKRKLEPAVDVEVCTIKLYRTPAVETPGYGNSDERVSSQIYGSTRLNLKEGDTQVIYSFFSRMQLMKPNFFYIMDLNDEGYLKNVFWIESRSRAAYAYFGDVVVVDNTCLSKKYDIPLLAFFGLNHHNQTLLLGCSLLADESFETYVWLLRAWLSCMSGRPPQTIITDRCKALQNAVSEVFPRAQHRLNLSIILDSIVDTVGEMGGSEVFHEVLYNTVYSSLKVDEFEVAWEEMTQQFGCRGYGWLQSLYEDRERWVPIYMKDTFLAGISIDDQHGEFMRPFFDGFVHKQTNLREFFDIYDFVLQKMHQKEVLCDTESREFSPDLRTRCSYELQLSKLYTKEIFLKFQDEMVLMSNCSGIAQIHVNGPIITYIVKERGVQGETRGARDFEVTYDKLGVEVRCMCNCFNFKGYLCRHALSVLNYNGIEEIPNHYILTRWRKNFKHLYASELGSSNIDISNPVQRFDHLHRRAMQVVDEGMTSQDHYMVAQQAFKESLIKFHLAADKHVS
ncbi:Protein FAR1-RELATED SEQUENCE 8 [Capsicum annuum]|uniref:Protein FAR1-RELATED SEQUENCE n=1 Tax=Capsicum annuum TaxID=4072 RepID=A0A2G2ZBV0_CAPAN|nr:protein FAR1-RELATED SEQUENCE 8 [Capsicum annuum]PHT79487.1 Protein FAR1-RELATED SEQUENCE 8 [Capsicum annuum]